MIVKNALIQTLEPERGVSRSGSRNSPFFCVKTLNTTLEGRKQRSPTLRSSTLRALGLVSSFVGPVALGPVALGPVPFGFGLHRFASVQQFIGVVLELRR